MKVGDVMVARDGPLTNWLRSGCEHYTHAILVSVEPFVMVSQEGDMMWSCADPNNYIALCRAHPDDAKAAFDRFHRRGSWAPRSVVSEE